MKNKDEKQQGFSYCEISEFRQAISAELEIEIEKIQGNYKFLYFLMILLVSSFILFNLSFMGIFTVSAIVISMIVDGFIISKRKRDISFYEMSLSMDIESY